MQWSVTETIQPNAIPTAGKAEVPVPQTARQPTFLPLTISAARSAAEGHSDPQVRASADVLWRRASEADQAAADCWMALLANCGSAAQRALPNCLHGLTEATAYYAGTGWWRGDGAHHRHRVSQAQHQIVEAVLDGDGEDFAEAFVGYDQAVATAVVAVHARLGSPA
jgi:DNA-binding FadR family transcriptional regulator